MLKANAACERCGGPYYRYPSAEKRGRRYCSLRCAAGYAITRVRVGRVEPDWKLYAAQFVSECQSLDGGGRNVA